jgi:hypothetical protein
VDIVGAGGGIAVGRKSAGVLDLAGEIADCIVADVASGGRA